MTYRFCELFARLLVHLGYPSYLEVGVTRVASGQAKRRRKSERNGGRMTTGLSGGAVLAVEFSASELGTDDAAVQRALIAAARPPLP